MHFHYLKLPNGFHGLLGVVRGPEDDPEDDPYECQTVNLLVIQGIRSVRYIIKEYLIDIFSPW